MDAFDRTQPLNPDPDPAAPGEPRAARGSASPAHAGRLVRWAAGVGVAAILLGGGIALGVRVAHGQRAAPASALLTRGGQDASAPGPALAAALGLPASLGASGSLGALTDTSTGHLPGGAHLRRAFAGLRRCVAAARSLRAAGHLAAARATLRSCLRRYLRLRLLLLGAVHGQLTFRTRAGFRTIAFERGVVQTVAGSAIVVKAPDNVTMTWDLFSKTVVVRARHKAGKGALAAGERVLVIGPVVAGSDDARLIVIHA